MTTTTASPKQISFIRSLFDSVSKGADVEGVTAAVSPIQNLLVLAIAASNGAECELDKRGASRIIDVLLPLSKKVQVAKPAADVRWRTPDNGATWYLFGDPAVLIPGTVVTVVSGSGDDQRTVEKTVDCVVRTEGANVLATAIDDRKAAKEAAKVALDAAAIARAEAEQAIADLVAKFHARHDTLHAGILLPTIDANARNTVAFWFIGECSVSLVLGGQGKVATPLDTQASVIERALSLTDDEVRAAMVAYGLEMGTCGFCCRSLTNDLSRKRGIGPSCWAKGGF